MDQRPLAFRDYGFESLRRHRSLSLSRECCVLSGRIFCIGLVTPAGCGVSECDLETSTMKMPWPTRAVKRREKQGVRDE